MVCVEICRRYKVKKAGNQSRYANGQKRCNTCEIFLYWEGFFCPCCGVKLRSKPRDGKCRRKIFAQEFKTLEFC